LTEDSDFSNRRDQIMSRRRDVRRLFCSSLSAA
jgi:hypothetical protein